MAEKKYILNKEVAAQKLQRLALQVAEQLEGDEAPLIIIGIRNSGIVIAEKIAMHVKQYLSVPVQVVSVTLDKNHPREVTLSEPIDGNDKNIIIADDVTNSGKTLLYALSPLLQFHPRRIQTLVLVERMHQLFPVKPDYVGLSIATTLQNFIKVEVEKGEVTGAFIE